MNKLAIVLFLGVLYALVNITNSGWVDVKAGVDVCIIWCIFGAAAFMPEQLQFLGLGKSPSEEDWK